MELGKIEQLTVDNKSKVKVMIRELILAVEEQDKFKRADMIAGLICEAMGYDE